MPISLDYGTILGVFGAGTLVVVVTLLLIASEYEMSTASFTLAGEGFLDNSSWFFLAGVSKLSTGESLVIAWLGFSGVTHMAVEGKQY